MSCTKCLSCGLHFSDPMRHPGPEWYERCELYTERRARSTAVPGFVASWDWRYQTFFSLRLNLGGNLLEVGCGSGMFLRLAKQRGYKVRGIDHDPSAVRAAREIYGVSEVETMSAEDLIAQPQGRCYEVICLFDVLEHLEDPLRVVEGLGKILTEGGHLVCTVPGYERWPSWFAPGVDVPPHHLTLWSQKALWQCFVNAGLEPETVISSPLLPDNLLHQGSVRWKVLQRLDMIGVTTRVLGQYVILPAAARALSLRHKAGGFTLFGVAGR